MNQGFNPTTKHHLRKLVASRYKPPTRLGDAILSNPSRSVFEFNFVIGVRKKRDLNLRVMYIYANMEEFMAGQKFDWEFVELKLEKSDQPKVEKFAKEYQGNAVEILADIAEIGYKISVSWVDKQNSYVVSVSGTDRSPDNQKQTITSWSDNLFEACAIAGYKVLILADDKLWKELATESSQWG